MLKTCTLTHKPQDDGSVLLIIQNNNANTVHECHGHQGGIVVHDALNMFHNKPLECVLPGPVDVTRQPSADVCDHVKTVRIPKMQLKIEPSTDDVIVL